MFLKKRQQRGFSTLEKLIALFLGGILAMVVVGLALVYNKYRKNRAAWLSMTRKLDMLRANAQDEIQNGGLGISGADPNSRLVVQDLTSGKPQPAMFVSEDLSTVTVLQTNAQGAGRYLPESPVGHLIVYGVEADSWAQISPGSLVFAVNPTGYPTLLQVTTTPRKTEAADLPTSETRRINPDRAVIFDASIAKNANGLASLGTAIAPNCSIVPVQRLIHYQLTEGGMVRDETTVTGNPEAYGIRPPQGQPVKVSLTPQLTVEGNFVYLTSTGVEKRLPSDLATLKGVRLSLAATAPDTRLSTKVEVDSYAEAWN
ncbi:MAG: hypothetical protein K1Y36_24540 [Blastocatellia bacterium]|nr:hypothetical protein [Blastocatellia bacterium]